MDGTPENTAPPGRPIALIVASCAGACFLLAALVCGASALGWRSFVSFGIASDMSEHDVHVRGSDLPDEDKQRVLKKIDDVRQLSREKSVSFFRYLSYDETLGSLADDGLTPDEVATFEAELDRLAADMKGR